MKPTKPEQIEFFIISDVAQISPDLRFDTQESNDGPNVNLIERSVLLQNTIANLQQARFLDRVAGLSEIGRNSRAKSGRLKYDAQTTFLQASGSDKLVESGDFSPREIRTAGARGQELFTAFKNEYFSLDHQTKDPQKYNLDLIAQVMILQSQSNRDNSLRPHKTPDHEEHDGTEVTETLDTPARLQALLDDPRAGFFPTTNQEKNQVLSYLDYLDNPKHPLRLTNHFIGVYNKSRSFKRRPENSQLDPSRGPVSIVYETGDYYRDAVRSREALQDLERLLLECVNQRITLGEETDVISLDHPGYPALIRYLDILTFLKTGSGVVMTDPLVTKTDRWDKERPVRHTRKRKMIGDIYNPHFTTPEVGARITEAVTNLNVGDARKAIGPAVQDQMRRENYLRLVLSKFALPPTDTPARLRRELSASSEAAKSILGLTTSS
jgi:hypothetical protein